MGFPRISHILKFEVRIPGLIFLILFLIQLLPQASLALDELDEDSFYDNGKSNSAARRHQSAWKGLNDADRRSIRAGKVLSGELTKAQIVGGLVGFGLGHSVIASYPASSWPFIISDIAGTTILATGLGSKTPSGPGQSGSSDSTILYVGIGVLAASRIWQIIDITRLARQRNREFDSANDKLIHTSLRPLLFLSPPVAHTSQPGMATGVEIQF